MENNCILIPKVKDATGKEVPSILYQELLKNPSLKGERPVLNYIYAHYLIAGGSAMDAAGFTAKDANGEHLWQDVYKFYGISNILSEQGDNRGIKNAKITLGAIDSAGNTIYYDNGKEALDKVTDFNNRSKSLVARVVKTGNKYSIEVERKNTRSQWQQGKAEEQAKLLQTAIETFRNAGLDLEALATQFPELFSVTNITNSIDYLKSFQKTKIQYATQKEVEFILTTLGTANTMVQRLISKWGSIENAAQTIYDFFKGRTTLTSGEQSLVLTTLQEAKKLNNIDLTALRNQLDVESAEYKADSESYHVSKILKKLKDDYGIDDKVIFEVGREINSFSQAAGNAVISLNRRIRGIEKKLGVTTETKELQKIINTLLKEIDKNRYYIGILSFMDEASKHIEAIEESFKNVSGTPGTQEYVKNMSTAIINAKAIIADYSRILDPLTRADSFEKDEDITPENLKSVIDIATKLTKHIAYLQDAIKVTEKGVMLDICQEWMGWGEELPDGRTVVSLLNTLTDDIGIIEYLYSASRSGNPLLAALGTITRDAQGSRTVLMKQYDTRIARADEKLKKAGIKDTKWMYDSDGRIINPYDWNEFSKEYKRISKELRQAGLTGVDFKLALWERVNNELTQEVVVDAVSGRTERVPKMMKNDPLKMGVESIYNLSPTQVEYYNTMMQIKGEFGTMFPEEARSQFLPPQVRSNSLFDAKGWKDAFKRLGSNIADKFRITESDIDLAGATTLVDTIDGDAIISVESNFNDEEIKDIPTYHTRKLQDQSKLITDFSGALQQLGSSAINYKCMSEIEHVALLMNDFLAEQRETNRIGEGTTKADVVQGTKLKLAKRIGKYLSTTNTSKIAEAYIQREFYGQKIKGNARVAKIITNLLGYTRFKQLATNIPGGFSNLLVGEYQMILEAIGGTNFNLADYAWANAMLFGDNTIHAPGRLMDFLTNDTTQLSTLIGNLFDPLNETFSELGHKRYNGVMRNLFSVDLSNATYGIGENLIHYTVMYAMLHKQKVFLDGELVPLYDAFEKTDKVDGNSELRVKSRVKIAEEDGFGGFKEGREITSIDDEYLLNFRDKIRNVNQECHGAMNMEDRGVLSQYILGRAVMQFRQWMVEHYSRRYRGLHWDGSSKQWTEGWWATFTKWLGRQENSLTKWSWKSRLQMSELKNTIDEFNKELQNRTLPESSYKSLEQKAKLAQKQLKNIKMAFAELGACVLLGGGSAIWWALDDDEDNPFWRFMMYQSKRLAWDAVGGTPVGLIQEGLSIVGRPVASIPYIEGIGYIFLYGLISGDIVSDYKTGKHKGENKYLVKSARYLPLYKDIDNWQKMLDEDHKYWHDMVIPYDLGRGATQ